MFLFFLKKVVCGVHKAFLKNVVCKDFSLKQENDSPYNLTLIFHLNCKYAIELIPVKSYKKSPVFLVGKTLKDITNHSLKLAEVFSN